jgi:hypothetical protein
VSEAVVIPTFSTKLCNRKEKSVNVAKTQIPGCLFAISSRFFLPSLESSKGEEKISPTCQFCVVALGRLRLLDRFAFHWHLGKSNDFFGFIIWIGDCIYFGDRTPGNKQAGYMNRTEWTHLRCLGTVEGSTDEILKKGKTSRDKLLKESWRQ